MSLSIASPGAMKNRKDPSGAFPTLKIVTQLSCLQPNSSVGPMCRLQCSPMTAPVSCLAREHGAIPQCQKVMEFSSSSSDTGSPKNTGCSDSCMPIYMDSAPYASASQLAATPRSFRMPSTVQTGVPNDVKKSGQQREHRAPIPFSFV